jgi:hypothetical protein
VEAQTVSTQHVAFTAPIPQSNPAICWAECLGGCSGQKSREHIVTESTSLGPQLNVRGFPFLNGRTIILHKRQFKSNILCRGHNSALSHVDQAATVAFGALRDTVGPSPKKKNEINGTLLERWFLKTLLNMEIVTDFKVPAPTDIVEIAFGKRRFSRNAGIFLLGYSSDPELGDERVSYTRLTEEGAPSKIVGGRFNFRNVELLLTLCSVQSDCLDILTNEGDVTAVNPLYHPPRLTSGESHSVPVRWQQ